jgi:hypothetical protein
MDGRAKCGCPEFFETVLLVVTQFGNAGNLSLSSASRVACFLTSAEYDRPAVGI